MKNQALFSSKDKTKKLKCRLLQFLFGVFMVKIIRITLVTFLFLSVFRAKCVQKRRAMSHSVKSSSF